MSTGETVAVCAILLIIGAAILYIVKAKKKGRKCIGCPDSSSCSGNCSYCALNKRDKNEEK